MKSVILLFTVLITLIFMMSCVSKQVSFTETYYETEYRTEEYSSIDKVTKIIEGVDKITADLYWENKELQYDDKVGVQYYGYKLPKHDTSEVVLYILFNDPTGSYSVFSYGKGEVAVYDLKIVGQLQGWRFITIPKCTTYYEVYNPSHEWTECTPSEDVYAEYQEWIKTVNAQLHDANLLGYITCTGYPKVIQKKFGYSDNITFWSDDKPPAEEIIFGTTGIQDLAIIVAGQRNVVKSVKLKWTDYISEERMVTKQRQIPYQVEKQRTVMQTIKVPFWEAIFEHEEVPVKLLQVGDKAPDFTLESIDGKSISLSDFRGKIALVVFSGINCRYNVEQMPYLIEAYKQSNGELVALQVYIFGDAKVVQDWVTKKELTTFPALPDPEQKVCRAYGVRYAPVNFFVDRKGIIGYIRIGPFQSQEEIDDILKSL